MKPMNRSHQNHSRLKKLAHLAFWIVATTSFLVFAKQGLAQDDTGEETDAQAVNDIAATPGYDVNLGARDPFLTPSSGEDQSDQNALQTTLELLRKNITVTIVISGSGAENGFAFVNGKKVKSGDNVIVTVTGKELALPVKSLHKNPPGVVLEYKGFEFVVYSK